MKYKCLVFDHDDTVVNSTSTIHYPAFLEYMKVRRPQIHLSLEDYYALNFDPGVIGLFQDICGLTKKEMAEEEAFWFSYVQEHIPDVYEGIGDIMWRHKKEGGRICVVSHSYSEYIKRDYAHGLLPEPDMIFGWDMDSEKRKPDPYSLYEIEKTFDLEAGEILVIDDLKPGYDMASSAGVPFAAAGWANNVPVIENFMRSNCGLYFKTVDELAEYLDG